MGVGLEVPVRFQTSSGVDLLVADRTLIGEVEDPAHIYRYNADPVATDSHHHHYPYRTCSVSAEVPDCFLVVAGYIAAAFVVVSAVPLLPWLPV